MKTNSLKWGILVAGISLCSFSCNQTIDLADHEEIIARAVENGEHITDSVQRAYIDIMYEIDENLDAIRDEQGLLVLGPKSNYDEGISVKDQILNNIEILGAQLAENKARFAKLEKELSSFRKSNKDLRLSIKQAKERILAKEDLIAEMKRQLNQSESDLSDTRKQLAEKNTELAEKNAENEVLTVQNTNLNRELNKVYFVSGTYKELKRQEIVSKKGGLLGIGRVKVPSSNMDKSKFIELNRNENTCLTLKGKDAKIITNHPAKSFTVNNGKNVSEIVIKDPADFWRNSNYLVVQVN